MIDKQSLVPRLRFPEFRNAGGWQLRPLSNFVESLDAGVSVNSGDRPATIDEKGILKTSAVTGGVFDPIENKVVADAGEMRRLKEPVVKNTIIISRMNTPALVGANAYIEEEYENLFLPDRLWAAKSKPNASMRFIAYILSSGKGRAALSELATGTSGSMKNIAKANVLELPVVTPSPKEQQKIADCLSSLDALIAAQAEKINALKDHKKGLMQQLFPREGETIPRLRFPEFREAEEWEEKTIGKIGEVVTGNTPSTTNRNYYGGDIMFASPADISESRFVSKTSKTLSSEGLAIARNIPAHSILFVCIGSTIGKVAQNAYECATNQQINVVIPFDEYVNSFIYFALNFSSAKMSSLAGKQAVPIINKSLFSSSVLVVPSDKEEQQKIGDCLSSLDALISAQVEKIDALNTHKKGLMQQLFPSVESIAS